jgi:Holliday junction resolvasome RuvABC endonuclease subunit
MTSNKANPKRVLALDPTSRGFGFAVLESPTTIIDWGVKAIREKEENAILAKVLELIRLYRPEVLVLEDCKNSRRCARVQSLLDRLVDVAATEDLKCRCFSTLRVKKVFQTFRARTKHEIAQAIAQQLPELAPSLPPYRKLWMSEDYQMPVFDAVALALTYFYSQPVRNAVVQKGSSE